MRTRFAFLKRAKNGNRYIDFVVTTDSRIFDASMPRYEELSKQSMLEYLLQYPVLREQNREAFMFMMNHICGNSSNNP